MQEDKGAKAPDILRSYSDKDRLPYLEIGILEDSCRTRTLISFDWRRSIAETPGSPDAELREFLLSAPDKVCHQGILVESDYIHLGKIRNLG